ncbi:MAG: hypothetical protein OHK0017_09350 [Patescibacteria group bacterium]
MFFNNILKGVFLFCAFTVLAVSVMGAYSTTAYAATTPATPTSQTGQNNGTTSTTSTTANSDTDLNLLPYTDIVDFIQNGVVPFLVRLAPAVAILAIVWGGYLYFFGSFTGKQQGLQAVSGGVIGLAIVLSYQVVQTLIEGTVTQQGLSADAIIKFINETLLNNFLYSIAGVVAVAFMVYGGYQYMFSPFQKEQGLKTIQNAVIGLVLVLVAKPIQLLISGTIVQDSELGSNLNKQPFLDFMNDLIGNFLLPLASVVTLFFIILAGYQWITAQGEQRKIENARQNLQNAIIGLVVVILSFTITQLIIYIVTNLNLGG